MEAVKLNVSLKRINTFLNCPDLDEDTGRTTGGSLTKNAVEMRQASFSWSGGDKKKGEGESTLTKIDLAVGKGSLVAVVGKIGSGKSSLLAAVLGELTKVFWFMTLLATDMLMIQVEGSSRVEGSISYVAQQAWIQNMTVCLIILSRSHLHVIRYERTSCLEASTTLRSTKQFWKHVLLLLTSRFFLLETRQRLEKMG